MSNLPSTREAIREQLESRGRNRTVVDAAQWFAYGHLSKGTGDGGVAVSSLIEAKDCFVRAAIAATDGQPS